MSRILILGGSGLVGKALINELKALYDVYATSKKIRLTFQMINNLDLM